MADNKSIFSTNPDKAVKFNLDGETINLNPDFFKMFMGPFMQDPDKMKRRIDDLQILITDVGIDYNVGIDFIESTNAWPFPEDYLEYKRISAQASTECCPPTENKGHLDGRDMTVYLAEEANIDLYMRDPLKRPDFEWGETYCTMQGNRIRIYRRNFDIVDATLTYYRQPRLIEILNCTDPYTLATSGVDVECEFKDDIVELIIDEAVAIIAGDIDNINQYVRGSASAEKNN